MNWDWLYSLYSIAAIFLVIEYGWRIVLIPLSFPTFVLNKTTSNIYLFILSLVPYYLMASYAALVGLGVNDGERSVLVLVAGGVFFLISGISGLHQKQKSAAQDNDYGLYRFAEYQYYGLLAALIYYVIAIFKPNLAINFLTLKLADLIDWVHGLPIIGLIVAIIAFLYAVSVIIMGLFVLIGMIGFAASKISAKA